VTDVVDRALGAMEDVRKVKLQLTGASTSIENARSVLDAMADRVRGHLEEITRLLAPAASPAGDGPDPFVPAARSADDPPSLLDPYPRS
jgi:hypothetical protein